MSELKYAPLSRSHMQEIISGKVTSEFICVGEKTFITRSESYIHACVLFDKTNSVFLHFSDNDYGSDYTFEYQVFPSASLSFNVKPGVDNLTIDETFAMSEKHISNYGCLTEFIS